MGNDIIALRNHLFETLEAVKNGRMESSVARAVCAVASEITKTAKLEFEYMQKFDARVDSGFIGNSHKPSITKEDIKRIKGGNPLL